MGETVHNNEPNPESGQAWTVNSVSVLRGDCQESFVGAKPIRNRLTQAPPPIIDFGLNRDYVSGVRTDPNEVYLLR